MVPEHEQKRNLGHLPFLLEASFRIKAPEAWYRVLSDCVWALGGFPHLLFLAHPFFAVGEASEPNLPCPFAVVETQELVAVSADAGRNSWLVARMKMKTLD